MTIDEHDLVRPAAFEPFIFLSREADRAHRREDTRVAVASEK
jgi:hypothetical protein